MDKIIKNVVIFFQNRNFSLYLCVNFWLKTKKRDNHNVKNNIKT